MTKELSRALLALVILISAISLAKQPLQHDPSQTNNASPVPPSTQDRKPQKVYHVGGSVKAPKLISSFQPSLDEEQIRKMSAGKKVVTGSTIVRIIVVEDGTVCCAKVLESFNRDLDVKAIDAVKRWKFEPALKKGVPVAVELAVQVDFHLYK